MKLNYKKAFLGSSLAALAGVTVIGMSLSAASADTALNNKLKAKKNNEAYIEAEPENNNWAVTGLVLPSSLLESGKVVNNKLELFVDGFSTADLKKFNVEYTVKYLNDVEGKAAFDVKLTSKSDKNFSKTFTNVENSYFLQYSFDSKVKASGFSFKEKNASKRVSVKSLSTELAKLTNQAAKVAKFKEYFNVSVPSGYQLSEVSVTKGKGNGAGVINYKVGKTVANGSKEQPSATKLVQSKQLSSTLNGFKEEYDFQVDQKKLNQLRKSDVRVISQLTNRYRDYASDHLKFNNDNEIDSSKFRVNIPKWSKSEVNKYDFKYVLKFVNDVDAKKGGHIVLDLVMSLKANPSVTKTFSNYIFSGYRTYDYVDAEIKYNQWKWKPGKSFTLSEFQALFYSFWYPEDLDTWINSQFNFTLPRNVKVVGVSFKKDYNSKGENTGTLTYYLKNSKVFAGNAKNPKKTIRVYNSGWTYSLQIGGFK